MQLGQDEIVETVHRPSVRHVLHRTLPMVVSSVLLAAWAFVELHPLLSALGALVLTIPGAIVVIRRERTSFPLFLATVAGASLGFSALPGMGPAWGAFAVQIAWTATIAVLLRGQGAVITNRGIHLRARLWSPQARIPHHHLERVDILKERWGTGTVLIDTGEAHLTVPGLRRPEELRDRLLVRRDQARDEVEDRAAVGRLKALVAH